MGGANCELGLVIVDGQTDRHWSASLSQCSVVSERVRQQHGLRRVLRFVDFTTRQGSITSVSKI
ncbi:hypothetical protein J6590_090540 [Homalodisca vitripennis]|nr:hypothetical protein J6590_090540 [Homalodisca vitripennis]